MEKTRAKQQMLAFRRSIMSSPKWLMLDESSMGLASLMKAVWVNGVKDVWEIGPTVLLVEQDASLTLNLTERVYLLEHGKVGLEGKSRVDNEEVKRAYFQ